MLFQTHVGARRAAREDPEFCGGGRSSPSHFKWIRTTSFPMRLSRSWVKLGWMGIPYSLGEYGGAGLDALSYAIAVEELARVDGGTGVILSAHVSLGSWPIFAYGTEEQRRNIWFRWPKGEKIGAFGLRRPTPDPTPGGTETTALDRGLLPPQRRQDLHYQRP